MRASEPQEPLIDWPNAGKLGAEAASVLAGFGLFYACVLGGLIGEPSHFTRGDALVQNLPNWLAQPAAWNPFIFAGYPSQGDPQTMALYPLARWLRGTSETWALFVITPAFIGSCSAYLFARVITGSRISAAFAGLAYGSNGFMLFHLPHVNLAHAAAWLPLLLCAVWQLATGGPVFWLAVVAGVTGLVASAGHPQILAFGLLMAGALWLATFRVGGWAQWCSRSAIVLMAVLLGLGLAAESVLPALELSAQSIRTNLSYDEFLVGSMRFGNLPQLAFPFISGGRSAGWLDSGMGDGTGGALGGALPYFARESLAEVTGYPGLMIIALASLALERGRRDLMLRYIVALSLLGLLFAMGRQIHAVGIFYLLPGLGQLRIPARHLIELQMGLALLAAWGSARWLAAEPDLRARLTRRAIRCGIGVVAAALALQTIVLATGYWSKYRDRVGVELEAAWPWLEPSVWLGIATLLFGLGALRWLGPTRPQLALGVAVAAAAIDFGSLARGIHAVGDPAPALAVTAPADLASLAASLEVTHGRIFSLASPHFGRPPEAVAPNLSQLWRIPSASGYGPLVLRRYASLTGADAFGAKDLAVLDANHRGLDLLAVEWLLAPPAAVDEFQRVDASASRWQAADPIGGVSVFRNRRALPRAWCVEKLIAVDETGMLDAIRTGRLSDGKPFDPQHIALIESESDHGQARKPRSGCDRVSIEKLEGAREGEQARRQISVSARGPTWLVISELDYRDFRERSGWLASVDGRDIPVVRTNYALLGIPLRQGRHRVELRFESRTRLAGERIGIASGLLLCLIALGTTAAPKKLRFLPNTSA